MKFYKHWLGDYAKDTAHLSLLEHGAYRVMLDAYYSTDKPLPADKGALYRICKAFTGTERKAVEKVADEFFPVNGDGSRHNRRADEEIANANAFAEAQAKRAHMRWHSQGNASHSHSQESQKEKAKTAAASPPSDPVKEEIWATGKAILTGQGDSRQEAGAFLGKLVKDYGQKLVLEAVRDCARTTPAAARGWLVARCQERRAQSGNKQSALEARNAAAAAEWLAREA